MEKEQQTKQKAQWDFTKLNQADDVKKNTKNNFESLLNETKKT